MPPSPFLLRVEAVNLGQFILDTQDLSTIRGGGLLLLNAPAAIYDDANNKGLLSQAGATDVERITAGASQAIFRFQAADLDKAKTVGEKLEALLRQHGQYQHATFVIDVKPEEANGLADDRERLLAMNRFRQMRQTRAVPPAFREAGESYCGIDLVRPATKNNPVRNDEKQAVSESVFVRATYGRDLKQAFYKPYLPEGWPDKQQRRFAQHFHEIAAEPPARCKGLKDKLAVIYIDGNSFSSIQRGCKTKEQQSEFDDLVQKKLRGRALGALLTRVHEDPSWRGTARDGKEIARLETLLWGGDELIWVVPAWHGLETVCLFFQEIANHYREQSPAQAVVAQTQLGAPRPVLQSPGKKEIRDLNAPRNRQRANAQAGAGAATAPAPPRRDTPLTHAAGMVFCHANSPIHRITDLAKKLAEQAKDATKRTGDALAYMVLESFDSLADDLGKARENHLPAGCTVNDLVIKKSDLLGTATAKPLTADLRAMKEKEFPRSALYRLLRELRRPVAEEAPGGKDFAWWFKRATREMKKDAVPTRFPSQPRNKDGKINQGGCANWMHLAELWDYLPESLTSA